MITPRIEKAILSGWATYHKVSHAFGSFGGVTIPKGHTAIILDIKWNHFFNPKAKNLGETTLKDLAKYSEYQIKIDGKKSTNYLIFRNKTDFKVLDPNLVINVNDPISRYIDAFRNSIFPTHPQPIQQDLFFVCEEYINLTISRNQFINNITTNFAALNPVSNQKPIPYGIAGENTLDSQQSESTGGLKWVYSPPNNANAAPNPFLPNGLATESYTQPYDKDSFMNNPKQNQDILFFTHPLVELGIVTFNSNDFDKIANQ